MSLPQSTEELIDNFSLFDEWEDRYRYIIELGKDLPPMDEALKTPDTKVEGCVSQVWFVPRLIERDGTRVFEFWGDSDAHIVRGLIAILFTMASGLTPDDLKDFDFESALSELGLDQHLSPSRTNGLYAMVNRLRAFAAAEAA